MNVAVVMRAIKVVLTKLDTPSTVAGSTGAIVMRNLKVSALQCKANTAHSTIPGKYMQMADTASHGTLLYRAAYTLCRVRLRLCSRTAEQLAGVEKSLDQRGHLGTMTTERMLKGHKRHKNVGAGAPSPAAAEVGCQPVRPDRPAGRTAGNKCGVGAS